MSRLAELIEELCPDGVEYRPLGELLVYQQPTPFLVSSKDYDPSYPTPVLTAGATFLLGYSSETHGVYAASKDDPVIIFDDFTTASKWVDFPFKLKSSAAKILTAADPNVADIRFLYFLMQTLNYQVGSHTRHWIAVYSKMPVCCPPLEVQREIVRILDQFTTLEAELEARRTQYEHYRNRLLSYESLVARGPVEMVKLGDVSHISAGYGFPKSEQGRLSGEYPFYKVSDMNRPRNRVFLEGAANYLAESDLRRLKMTPFPVGSIVFPKIGAAIATNKKRILSVPSLVDNNVAVCIPEGIDAKYLYYWFLEQDLLTVAHDSGAVPSIRKADLEQLDVPMPTVEEQTQIVAILDRFDALVNDISSGLPAEIEARRTQYEYYRDRLLSFPEKSAD